MSLYYVWLTESRVVNWILSYLNTAKIITRVLKGSKKSTMSNSLPMPIHCRTLQPPRKCLSMTGNLAYVMETKDILLSYRSSSVAKFNMLYTTVVNLYAEKENAHNLVGDYKLYPGGKNTKRSLLRNSR